MKINAGNFLLPGLKYLGKYCEFSIPTTLSEKAAQALSSHPILSLLELLLATMGLIMAKVLDAQATALFWGLPMPLELQGT